MGLGFSTENSPNEGAGGRSGTGRWTWETTTVKHAEVPALSAPDALPATHTAGQRLVPSAGAVARRHADLGAEEPSISDELVSAWEADARCAECGKLVVAVSDAALLVGPNRIAHRDRCFVPALLRAHPLLKRLAARMPAQEVTNAPTEPSGEPDVRDARGEDRAGGRDG